MPYTLTTAPAVEPVTIADVSRYLKIYDSAEAPDLQWMISAARTIAEGFTGKNFISTQWTLVLPQWLPDDIPNLPNLYNLYTIYLPAAYNNVTFLNYQDLKKYGKDCRRVILRRGPVLTIDAISYYDATTTTLTAWSNAGTPPNWYLAKDEIGRWAITLDPSATFPSTYVRPDAVQIKFTAGYGTAPSSVPADLRAAIRFIAAFLYDTADARSAVKASTPAEMLEYIPAARHILESHREAFVPAGL